MKSKKDNPGVYPPPPLFYVIIFFLSILLQNYFPITKIIFERVFIKTFSPICIGIGVLFLLPALVSFFKSKNTLITIKPATSLQTTGIYKISRNPMYIGLLFIYVGIAIIKGNWWTFILIPFVLYIVTRFVIINEEKYLERAFGQEYLNYKIKVRRWL